MRPPPRCHQRPRHRQRGIAIITALLVVTIATVLAVELVWQTNLDLRRSEGLLGWEQARQFGYAAEDLAATELQKAFDQSATTYTRQNDCQEQAFALGDEESKSFADGAITGRVCDLESRFNLNNLVDPKGKKNDWAVKQFRRLLQAVGAVDKNTELTSQDVDEITDAVVDWIDPNTTPEFNGAEDAYYTTLTPPYQAANFWFTSTSELLAVKGVTPEIYQAVLPYVAALPVGPNPTKINVNTASVPVYMSLGEEVSQQQAEQWFNEGDPDKTDGVFESTTQFQQKGVDSQMIGNLEFTTKFMALSGTVSIGTTRLDMYSLLEHTGQSWKVRLRYFGSIEADAPAVNTQAVKDAKTGKDLKDEGLKDHE